MKEPITGPAYRIVTPRLVIRCWSPADAPLLHEAVLASLDHLRPWMPWAHDEPQSLEARMARLRRMRGSFDLDQDYTYGIFSLDESRVLGSTGLHTRIGPVAREIGYWVHVDYTKRGYATETAAALTRVAFEVDEVQRVEIHMDPANTRSAAVPARLGYRLEAVLHNRVVSPEGESRDSMIWTLFAADYRNTPSAQAQVEAYDVVGRRIL